MKVLVVVAKNPFCHSSASANRLLSLTEAIAFLGVKVDFLIYGGYTSALEKESFGLKGSYMGLNYEYVVPTLIAGYWKVRFHKYIGNRIRNRAVIRNLQKRVTHESGVIWTDAALLSFQFAVTLKRKNLQATLFIEMSEFLDIHRYNKGNWLQKWQDDRRQRLFAEKAYFAYHGMALMTQTLLKHYQGFPKPQPKLLHLPMTVDLERFSGSKSQPAEFQSPYILYVGVMNDAKDGISNLIKAFNLIKERFPFHNLYLVGAWNYDTPIHLQFIKDLGLVKRIFWMREYSRDSIPNIICNADLLVLPRPNSKQAEGGFPTKLGEYLASGKPVCATRVGEIPNYLVDSESIFFAEPGSVESFAQSMDRALRDPINAQRVGANGRKVAEQYFNKNVQAITLLEFLEGLSSEREHNKRMSNQQLS